MTRPVKVVFVCLHGAAKSVIAAEYLGRLAREAGHDVDAVSAGVEPYDSIPPDVAHGLASDGFDVTGRRPRPVTTSEVAAADVVVSFGCALEVGSSPRRLINWEGIPDVSDGYAAARDAIIGRLRTLLGAEPLANPGTLHD